LNGQLSAVLIYIKELMHPRLDVSCSMLPNFILGGMVLQFHAPFGPIYYNTYLYMCYNDSN